jgi:two-component system, NtrC family, response regulator HydG
MALQAKLLRVLESGEIRAVGSDTVRHCDVRLIAATHRVLEDLVREGKFREDLYYRLRVLPLRLTSLRERREDIPLLLDHFLAIARRQAPTSPVTGFTPEAVAMLSQHSWPGNVRELEHLVQSLIVTGSEAMVGADSIRAFLREVAADHPLDRARKGLWSLRELEQEYISWVVEHTGGNKTRASEILGIDPSTLYRREVRGKA